MNFKIIGHRGFAGYAPENTMASFEMATKLGISAVEFDVRLTNDNKLIVIHDENLDRTTNGQGKICETNWNYIKNLDAGSWFNKKYNNEKVPTLLEVLQFLKIHNIQANLEIKPIELEEKFKTKTGPNIDNNLNQYNHEQIQIMAKTVIKLINKHEFTNILISSFSVEIIKKLAELAKFENIKSSLNPKYRDLTKIHSKNPYKFPTLELAIICHHWTDIWRELPITAVHLNHEIATAERIKKIKEAGLVARCYTVNNLKLAQNLLNMGVTEIFSDYINI